MENITVGDSRPDGLDCFNDCDIIDPATVISSKIIYPARKYTHGWLIFNFTQQRPVKNGGE